jgi:hypothetical protein
VIANSLFITGCWKTTWTWIKETGGSSTDERKSGQKSCKIFTQTIIGMYLCPGSRAEKQKRQWGEVTENGRNGKKSCSRKLS